ncbi:hypothetical protein FF098_014745 [Parvularcula flava]|uniref:Uncharacterized protein n=1 Tax=Aquisalinus luteolus TaxID=1566827 RepID=A0A8J3A9X3_9PROT|nr:hypothetical protein [Aquisalinus luteolus]NHK29176.1 hypothetical protein [Aquisalinus luteolus]GGI00075.1 hypothetical protein GCM10011355_27510 [Aquisalinus luteolus]
MTNQPGREGQKAILIAEMLHQGRAMLLAEDHDTPSDEEIVWRLLQEAAETQRAIRGVGPRYQNKHGVDYFHSPAEIFGTEVEMSADNIQYPPQIIRVASKQALDRYMEVMTWFTYIHTGRNERRSRKAMLALANGCTLQRVADMCGYGSRAGVKNMKDRALTEIAQRLRRMMLAKKIAA